MKVAALASFFALLLLTLLWEGWLAPKTHWLFWLVLKTLPLLALLPGLLQNRLRSFVIATLVLLLYLTEGLVLSWTERATGFGWRVILPYALLETVLVLVFILSASLHVRATRKQQATL
jgi:uncharacterized membrane protein